MTSDQLLPLVQPLCPTVDEEVIRDFLSRMDDEYLTEYPGRHGASSRSGGAARSRSSFPDGIG